MDGQWDGGGGVVLGVAVRCWDDSVVGVRVRVRVRVTLGLGLGLGLGL